MHVPSSTLLLILASVVGSVNASGKHFLGQRKDETTVGASPKNTIMHDAVKAEGESYWTRLMQETTMSVAPTSTPEPHLPESPSPKPPSPESRPTPPPTPLPMSPPTPVNLLLYRNDFEDPNAPVQRGSCNPISQTPVNTYYGTSENQFNQQGSVETFLQMESFWNSTTRYSDPDGRGRNYSIGMLRSRDNDLLALSFDAKNFNFVNVGMDISSIDLPCAGGPFGIEDPIFRVSAIDSPDGVPRLTGTVLDSANMTGPVAPNQWTFLWTNKVVALNVTESTNGNVSIVWDLIQSGYAAFDNLIVAASDIQALYRRR
jgi:hypothetical protein